MKIDKRKGRVIKYSKELLADIFTFFEDLRKGQRSRFDNDSMRVDSDVGLKYHRFKTEDKEIYGISYLSKKYKYEKIKRELCKKHNLLPKQFPSQSYFYELIRKQFPPKL